MEQKRTLATEFPELAKEWHPTRNGGVSPSDVAPFSSKKVWWLGPCGHEWETTVKYRSHGGNCPYCSGKRILSGFNDFATTHPELLDEWDYDKNTVSPKEIGVGNIKACWKCKTCGHEWTATVSNRVGGSGCPICGRKRAVKKNSTAIYKNSLSFHRPDLLKDWDYEKNTVDPEKTYYHSNKKVWWICHIHNYSYQAPVDNRVNGSGCPVCANKIVLPGVNDFESWCIRNDRMYLLDEWDRDKNTLAPDHISPFANKKIHWKCKEGHEYCSSLANRTGNNTGCPVCNRHFWSSFPEQAILYYVKKHFPNAVSTYTADWLERLELDILISDINTAVEYDGEHWHKSITAKDRHKNELCEEKGITLIRVREEGLPPIDGCINISVPPRSSKGLNRAILEVLALLGIQDEDVDVDRDTSMIVASYDFSKKENSIANKYPELLSEWDYEKNGDSDPEYINYGTTRKYWWKCPICGESYLRSVNARTNQKQGCPNKACLNLKRNKSLISTRILKNGSLADRFPSIAAEWDPEKNNGLTPRDVTGISHKKAWWICPKGHNYQAVIGNRTKNGTGCPFCAGKKHPI